MIDLRSDQNPPYKQLSKEEFDKLAINICKMIKYSRMAKLMTNKQLKDYIIEKSEFFMKLDIFSLDYQIMSEILERFWQNYYNN